MLEGYIHPDFSDVARVLRRQIPDLRRRGRAGGAAVCVYHRGEVVVDCWGGTRDAAGRPWQEDTISLSYSTTKGVASTLLHILADRGLVDYDRPVADYWPEFAAAGKERITIRQVLCHEAGLYRIRDMIDDAARMLDWKYMSDALAASAPCHEPGEAHGYHAWTYGWLVGEIVQRVTGRRFSEVLESELAGPLGLDGCYVGVPQDQMHRRASQVPGRSLSRLRLGNVVPAVGRALHRAFDFAGIPVDLTQAHAALVPPGIERLDFGSEAWAAATVPAANGMFTARALARLYAMLAGGGEIDGVRILSQETVERASQVQNRGVGRVVPYPLQWRLGYHRVNTLGARVPRGFGHSGFGGSGGWADPERHLALGLVLNSGTGTPFGDLRIVRISTTAIRCADRR
jgi:CubicO group peptidase (beta-lactamase class C family)